MTGSSARPINSSSTAKRNTVFKIETRLRTVNGDKPASRHSWHLSLTRCFEPCAKSPTVIEPQSVRVDLRW